MLTVELVGNVHTLTEGIVQWERLDADSSHDSHENNGPNLCNR